MVTRFNSISTRKLTKAILILTCDKSIVAMSDYGETHKLMKKCILNSLLGANAQKRHRVHRDIMIKNIINCLYDEVKSDPGGAVNLISFFKNELFRLAFKQALGRDVEPIYVEELGMKLSESQMFDILVVHPVMGLIEVDWRDFFPYLRWIPNKSMELKVQKMAFQRNAVMKALVEEQKKRIKSGEHKDCYLDFLLAEAETLTEKQVLTMVWEAIFEISDTTMVTTEWAMFELARNIKCQDRLYQEIKEICGSDKITEEHLPKLHYLNAVFHETLRRHSPLPVLPPRYVHEDIELGGFHIAAGSEVGPYHDLRIVCNPLPRIASFVCKNGSKSPKQDHRYSPFPCYCNAELKHAVGASSWPGQYQEEEHLQCWIFLLTNQIDAEARFRKPICLRGDRCGGGGVCRETDVKEIGWDFNLEIMFT